MEIKKKVLIILIVTTMLGLLGINTVFAHSDSDFTISLQRSFGYGGFGNDIQGYFQIKLKGPLEDVASVTYTLDGEPMGTVTESPFKLDFNTDDFRPGERYLGAMVKLTDGDEVTAQVVQVRILSKEGASQSIFKILIPLFALIGGAALISSLVAGRANRSHPGQKQDYNGIYGGAVCPKCGHPFARSILGVNVGFFRLERCPNCGKWISSHRATPAELEAAEEAEAEKYRIASGEKPNQSEGEKPDEKAIDDSRFLDE
ncbi:MAG TPA: hypothetical protein VLR89_05010 [Anaerolineaceae bacterium]|nr:hypothetical protein [Anaerolineaceae bacterium]